MAKQEAQELWLKNPEVLFARAMEEISRQTDRVMECITLYQKQAEKFANLSMDGALEAATAGQKLAKEWVAFGNKVTAETTKALEANLKENARMFGSSGKA